MRIKLNPRHAQKSFRHVDPPGTFPKPEDFLLIREVEEEKEKAPVGETGASSTDGGIKRGEV